MSVILRVNLTGEVRPGEVRPYEVRPFEVHPGEVRPSQLRSWFDRVAVDLHAVHATGRPAALPERPDQFRRLGVRLSAWSMGLIFAPNAARSHLGYF